MESFSEDLIKKHSSACESAIKNHEPQSMVDNTSAIARLANRVLMVAKQEADNSEDPSYVSQLNAASEQLQAGRFFFLILLYIACSCHCPNKLGYI